MDVNIGAYKGLRIGRFRIVLCLFFKARPRAKPFM